MGGNLVSIPTRRVQAFLITKMGALATTDLWIGLNSINQDEFYWSDGKARRYSNWGYNKNQRHSRSFYRRWHEESQCVLISNNPTLGIGKWIFKSCNDTNGYICARDLDPNSPSKEEPTVPNIYVSVGNDSIKAVTQNLTWDDAKRHCEGDKANLASLRNEWAQAYVELLAMTLKTPLWIGLNKNQTNNYFRYIDGWHLNYASWAEGEPRRNRPCVYMDVDGKWKTAFCNETMKSVCMQSTDIPPTDSPSFPGVCPEEFDYHSWLPFKGYCYLFITAEIEWPDAASSCKKYGGTLASIEDSTEQAFIKSNLERFQDSHTSFWIGLYKTHKGTWKWLDDTVLDYINWGSEDLDNTYGEIATDKGLWSTGSRWADRPYICKTPKVILPDPGSKPGPLGPWDHRSRVHTSLIVVLIIMITSMLIIIAFFLYKKSPKPLPTFDNPLYFDSERSQPDVVDTNKMIENAEEENPEPILSL
ncbi:hypothetical protein PAMP_005096 [Pampus punctatissimus]